MSQSTLEFESTAEAAAVPQNFADCPDVGLYVDKSFEDYAGWRAVNSGVVKAGRVSPKHFQAALEGRIRSDDTKDRKLGRAIHARLLEPDTFAERFIIACRCAASLKGGDRKGEPCGNNGVLWDAAYGVWLCGVHSKGLSDTDTREVISQDDVRRCEGAVQALKSLPESVRSKLSRPGFSEASIVWLYRDLLMKCRLDRLSKDKTLIVDVKKIQVGAGSIQQIEKACLTYGYHIQAALYVQAVQALFEVTPEFWWLFVEDNDPFDMRPLRASETVLEIGWREVESAVNDWKNSSQPYPGYIRSEEALERAGGLPAWKIAEWEELRNGVEF